MEYISIIIAGVGVAVSMYYSNKNLKTSIVEQERQRQADMFERQELAISKAEKETERHTPVSYTHLDVYKRQVQAGEIMVDYKVKWIHNGKAEYLSLIHIL